MALDLVRIVPWLAAEAPARLVPALMRFVTCQTPWEAAALAAALLDAPLSLAFWKGAAMVVAGSILCWLATRGKGLRPASASARARPQRQ